MIYIKTAFKNSTIIKHLDKMISTGMTNASYKIAMNVRNTARSVLYTAVTTSTAPFGRHWTGQLSDAIMVLSSLNGEHDKYRNDVAVIMRHAPYAAWIEFGRRTPFGLPYCRSGGKPNYRDFSKTTFEGYWYLNRALDFHKGNRSVNVVKSEILNSIKNKQSLSKLGEVIEK